VAPPDRFVGFARFNRGRIGLLLAVATAGLASSPPPAESMTDAMTDDELRRHRAVKVAELERRSAKLAGGPEAVRAGLSGVFFCTVYYTPKESGFTAERGFDATPMSAPGLDGRTYPRSFLQAVKREGFGRLITPVNGRNYLQYVSRGRYQFAAAPLGSRGNVLVPRKSCAVARQNRFLRQRMKLVIDGQTVNEVTGAREWDVADTGGGLHPLQIDLYWGEDEPRGPVGRNQARPAGTWMEYSFEVSVSVE
jgi:hypothetical protein